MSLPESTPPTAVAGAPDQASVRRLYSSASWLGGSTLVNAAIGFAFWIVAARVVEPDVLGVEGAVLNVVMLLAWLCQLGMQNALTRFMPVAGAGTRSLVVRTYLASTVLALVCGLAWLAWSALRAQPLFGLPLWLTAWSAFSVLAWTIFSLQDSVLVGARKPHLVAVENAVYSAVKLVALVPLAVLLPEGGLLVAWVAPVLLFVPVVNAFVFRRLLPRDGAGEGPVGGREVARFVAHDFPGGAASMLAVRLVPVLVLAQLGGRDTAYFLVAWQVLMVLELSLSSLGLSLTVEGAGADDATVRALVGQLLRRVLPLALAGCLALVVLARPVLSLFGEEYAGEGTTVLRVLVATLALRVVVDAAVSVMRVRDDLRLLLLIEVVRAPVALGACWLLAGAYGVTGAAASYGVTNIVLAVLAGLYLRGVFRAMDARATA
ncbi:lipopolysaccharide biosynthesis protein [Aquipuribacter hungaricus]|uniref:Lipopolysaccharide biosynthesis protein n=1 Tax=Aquipuribacter hungaricus TaxID=545624 RepID=A0ABV7WKF1_9MICO